MAYTTLDDPNMLLQVSRLRGDLSLKYVGSWEIDARVVKLHVIRDQSDRIVADTLVYLPALPLQIETKEALANQRSCKNGNDDELRFGR